MSKLFTADDKGFLWYRSLELLLPWDILEEVKKFELIVCLLDLMRQIFVAIMVVKVSRMPMADDEGHIIANWPTTQVSPVADVDDALLRPLVCALPPPLCFSYHPFFLQCRRFMLKEHQSMQISNDYPTYCAFDTSNPHTAHGALLILFLISKTCERWRHESRL